MYNIADFLRGREPFGNNWRETMERTELLRSPVKGGIADRAMRQDLMRKE
jgi:hypothetical protein